MKIEIDTDKLKPILPILIKPTGAFYSADDTHNWEISNIDINFDMEETEEHNKYEALKLCDLIIDMLKWSNVEHYDREHKKQFFDWVREALREELKLNKE